MPDTDRSKSTTILASRRQMLKGGAVAALGSMLSSRSAPRRHPHLLSLGRRQCLHPDSLR